MEIADGSGRREDVGDLLRPGVDRIGHHVAVARRHGIDLSGRDVDALDVSVPLLADADQDRAPVAAPDRAAWQLTARRALIAAEPAVDVEVVGGGQVAWCASAQFGDPEVGLRTNARVSRRNADEGDALAVGRERVGADATLDADDPGRLAALFGIENRSLSPGK